MPATPEEVAASLVRASADVRHRYAVDGLMLAHLRMPEIQALRTLRAGFADLGRVVGDHRLRLYRGYVGATVTRVTPLLVRLCEQQGFDLEELAGLLGPDRPWTPWLCGPRPAGPARHRKGQGSWCQPTRGESDLHDLRRFAHSGVVVRSKKEGGAFGVRVLHDCLELGAYLGEARVRTFGAGGAITLPGEIPATVAAALPGRPLDQVVQHPLLDGAGCVVREVHEPTFWGTKVDFALRAQDWTMPWARPAGRCAPSARA